MPTITVKPINQSPLEKWAKAWPLAIGAAKDTQAYISPSSDFWHVHDFEPGKGGQTEVLWVTYRPRSMLISRLEVHWLTEQAVVPLGSAPLIQVLCPTKQGTKEPDLDKIEAWQILPGQGICMMPGCWHATLAVESEVNAMMLTRRSTTLDLVKQLNDSNSNSNSQRAKVNFEDQLESSFFTGTQMPVFDLNLSLLKQI